MKPVNTSMRKYYIGLGILGLFSLFVFILVLSLASGNKQDSKTYTSANDISAKLNSYVDTNQVVPESLSAAGIKDVPTTIIYTKLSDDSYTFCVTYKDSGNTLDASALDAFTGDLVTQQLESSATNSANAGAESDLFIDPVHHKGQNCQTIKPYIIPSATSSPCLAIDNVPCSTEDQSGGNSQGSTGAVNDNGSPAGTTANGDSTSSIDDEKANDVYAMLSGLSDFELDNNNKLPTNVTVNDGVVSFTPTDPNDPVTLGFYTKSTQLKTQTYKAGDKNTTNVTTNDIMVIELDAVCSQTSVGDPVASDDTNGDSYAVLFSDQSGTNCLDSNS